jgi:hypothetical protein
MTSRWRYRDEQGRLWLTFERRQDYQPQTGLKRPPAPREMDLIYPYCLFVQFPTCLKIIRIPLKI